MIEYIKPCIQKNTFSKKGRLICTGRNSPAFNMACDEALGLCVDLPVLRFYQWSPPAVSLGYFQKYEDVEPFCRNTGCTATVRRITGGGAIYHFRELTYSLITRPGELRLPRKTSDSYKYLHDPFVSVFRKIGLHTAEMRPCDRSERKPVCFDSVTCFDISVNGKKLMGSAQRRHKKFFLQHGSMPLEHNSFSTGATSFEEELGMKIDADRLAAELACEISLHLGINFLPSELLPRETDLIADILLQHSNCS